MWLSSESAVCMFLSDKAHYAALLPEGSVDLFIKNNQNIFPALQFYISKSLIFFTRSSIGA